MNIRFVILFVATIVFGGCFGELDTSSNSGSGGGGSGGQTTGPEAVKYRFWIYRFYDQSTTVTPLPSSVANLLPYVQAYIYPGGLQVPLKGEYGLDYLFGELVGSMCIWGGYTPIIDRSISTGTDTYYLEDYLKLEKNSCQQVSVIDNLNVPEEFMVDLYDSDNTFRSAFSGKLDDGTNLITAKWDLDLANAYVAAVQNALTGGVEFPGSVFSSSNCGESNSTASLRQVMVVVVPGDLPASGQMYFAGKGVPSLRLMVINSAAFDMTNWASEFDPTKIEYPGVFTQPYDGVEWFKRSLVFCHEAFHILQNDFESQNKINYVNDLLNNFNTVYRGQVGGEPSGSPATNFFSWNEFFMGEFAHHRFWSLYIPGHTNSIDTWRHQCMMSKNDDTTVDPPGDFSPQDSFNWTSKYCANKACQHCWQETVSGYYR